MRTRGWTLLWVLALGCGDTAPVEPPPDEVPQPTTITVTPEVVSFTAIGETAMLTAEVRDQSGTVVDHGVAWSSNDEEVAAVSAEGLVSATGNGAATITATAGTAAGTAGVTVAQEVSAIGVAPAEATVVIGDTLRLVATAEDANGHTVADVAFTWASMPEAVATVTDFGLVLAVSHGRATVTVRAGGKTAAIATITVPRPVPVTVDVSPDSASVRAVGDTVRFTAVPRDADGAATDHPVTWASSDEGVATVTDGLATATGVGQATLTATAGGVSGSAHMDVRTPPEPATVEIAGEALTFAAFGDTARFGAVVRDQYGDVLAHPVTWAASNTSVVTVADGLVTAVGHGSATVSAAAGEAAGSVFVRVEQVVVGVTVTPEAATMTVGQSVGLVPGAEDSNGHHIQGVPYEWATSDAAVAHRRRWAGDGCSNGYGDDHRDGWRRIGHGHGDGGHQRHRRHGLRRAGRVAGVDGSHIRGGARRSLARMG